MSLLLIADALGEYSAWEATFRPRPSLAPVCAPAVAGLHREAAVRSQFIKRAKWRRGRRKGGAGNKQRERESEEIIFSYLIYLMEEKGFLIRKTRHVRQRGKDREKCRQPP